MQSFAGAMMRFSNLDLSGARLVQLERLGDERGFFARTWCANEFEAAGLPTGFVQSSISYNVRAGTIRGMHFQWAPSREGKLVRCLRGAAHDVLLDLRPDSPSFLRHESLELTQENRDAVYIPPGVAHGCQSLSADCEILYQMTDCHQPQLAHGFRWNDAAFRIEWPLPVTAINERDRTYPDFDRAAYIREFRRRAAEPRP